MLKICETCECSSDFDTCNLGTCRLNPPDTDGKFPAIRKDFWCSQWRRDGEIRGTK